MQGKTNVPIPPTTVGNYTLLTNELLGKGATGYVYKGFNNFTKQPVAIKAIDLSSIRDEATKSLLDNQKEGLRSLNAPNVIKLEDIVEDARFCYIITELCEGTTVKEYLTEKKVLGQNQAMSIFRKLTAGSLEVAHQCMIHRDLKPANVMIDNKGEVKIIDFGYCEIIRSKKVMKTFNVGSPSYMSPQAYLRTLYSEKSDSWSLGVILYELLHGKTLDQGMDINNYFEELKNDPRFVEKRISPAINLQVRQLLQKTLKYTPEERLSISAVKYQADLYHVNLRQKNTNINHAVQPIGTVIKQVPKVKFQGETHSLSKIDNQNKLFTQGFVSFKEFVNHTPKDSKAVHHIKMKQLTSLEDFDAQSNKASSPTRGVAMNQKLSHFLQNTVKQHKNIRQSSSNNIPLFSKTTVLSSNSIPHFPPQSQPQLYRHATVRFN